MAKIEIRPLDSDARYKTAHEKLMGVRARLTDIEQRINQFDLERGGGPSRKADLEAQARNYLESKELPATVIGPSSPELEKLHLERRIARKAEELAARDLDKVRETISREVSREQESRNRERTQAIALLVRQLVQAAKDYRDFRDEFDAAGLACLLPVGAFPFLGFSTEPGSGIAATFLAEASRAGLIR